MYLEEDLMEMKQRLMRQEGLSSIEAEKRVKELKNAIKDSRKLKTKTNHLTKLDSNGLS